VKLTVHPSHKSVMEKYGRIAVRGTCCGPQSSCCGGGRATDVALGVGYSDPELATLPEGAALKPDLERMMAEAGLVDRSLENKDGAVAAMLPGEDPMTELLRGPIPEDSQPANTIASRVIPARKP